MLPEGMPEEFFPEEFLVEYVDKFPVDISGRIPEKISGEMPSENFKVE